MKDQAPIFSYFPISPNFRFILALNENKNYHIDITLIK